jgi:hypothetical protein
LGNWRVWFKTVESPYRVAFGVRREVDAETEAEAIAVATAAVIADPKERDVTGIAPTVVLDRAVRRPSSGLHVHKEE